MEKTEEEIDEVVGGGEDEEGLDFLCVPINNLDHDTVTINRINS